MAAELVMPGMLKVLIEGASDLAPRAASAHLEPFYVLQCGAQRCRSKAASRGTGCNPAWSTAHKFALSNEMVMRVTIKDEASKESLGEALIDLSRWLLITDY